MERKNDEITLDVLSNTINVYHNGNRNTVTAHMDAEFRRMVAAVMALGKSGSVSFTITAKRGTEENSVAFNASIRTVVPEPVARGVEFFANQAGEVYADDPRQKTVPFRDVNQQAK